MAGGTLLPHLILRPTQQDPATLSSSPQLIPRYRGCDLNRFRKPKQTHNYDEVNGDTEASGHTDTEEAGIIGKSGCLQPPASGRSTDRADQLPAYGSDHECGANAHRAARITDRWYSKKQARHDDRNGNPRGTKRQTSESGHYLGSERND